MSEVRARHRTTGVVALGRRRVLPVLAAVVVAGFAVAGVIAGLEVPPGDEGVLPVRSRTPSACAAGPGWWPRTRCAPN
ncbi:hypothetical protein [Lentzea sp.]|uniref:hypothetical protein n=1 Tax=Lentzea sp. TaxID=56099 RepID=UPI002ED24937